MTKKFSMSFIVEIDFHNDQDYYNESQNDFHFIKQDILNGSRNYSYNLGISDVILSEIKE
jgi:hypothetical protein